MNFDPVWFMCSGLSWLGSIWFSTAESEVMAAIAAAGTLDLSPFDHQRFSLTQANDALASLPTRGGSCGFANVVVMPG